MINLGNERMYFTEMYYRDLHKIMLVHSILIGVTFM
jgi:hypothetical protein